MQEFPCGVAQGADDDSFYIDDRGCRDAIAGGLRRDDLCAGPLHQWVDDRKHRHDALTFDKDTPFSGKSCNGQCATNWPPFAASSTDQPGGDWTIVVRDDGTRQWAYSGQPLYFWAKDKKPGDTTGDGVNNVWHAVRPPPEPLTGSMNC